MLVDIFRSLFATVKEETAREMLITTLIKFMDRLSTQSDFPKSIIFECFAIMESDIEKYGLLYIRNSGYFKTCLDRLAQHEEFFPIVDALTLSFWPGAVDSGKNSKRRNGSSEEPSFRLFLDAKK